MASVFTFISMLLLTTLTSLIHLVGSGEQRRWHDEPKCASGRQVNKKFEIDRLYYWQISGLFAFEDAGSVATE